MSVNLNRLQDVSLKSQEKLFIEIQFKAIHHSHAGANLNRFCCCCGKVVELHLVYFQQLIHFNVSFSDNLI